MEDPVRASYLNLQQLSKPTWMLGHRQIWLLWISPGLTIHCSGYHVSSAIANSLLWLMVSNHPTYLFFLVYLRDVIGPTLFLIYINDLPECSIYCPSIGRRHTHVSYNTQWRSCTQLQADIDNLEIWEQAWSMESNPDKCEVLKVTRKRTVIHHEYTLHGKLLKEVTDAKYLGVHISHYIKWNCHRKNYMKKPIAHLVFSSATYGWSHVH